ncbi:MAG: metallophosphoesterase family protein [Clostridia bacterium]|nr:metallophosphoesterase family protein [Clostridia bacterium]
MDQKKKKQIVILGILIAAMLIVLAAVLIISSAVRNGRKKTAENIYCIAVTFGEDPKTQKNFSWYTETETTGSIVQYYPVTAEEAKKNEFDAAKAAQTEGFSETVDTYLPHEGEEYSASASLDPKSYMRHGAFVSGLTAGTRYIYRVGDGKNWSEPAVFETAPDETVNREKGFSFIIVSDVQGYIYSDYELWGNVFDQAYKKCPEAAFAVNLGDFVERQENALVWQYYFGIPDGFGDLTTVPVAGNKDDKMFLKYFLLGSKDGVTGLNGYYSFDYMNVHFTVVNTGDGSKDLSKAQLKWLKRDLESENSVSATFRIVLIHKAPYSDRNHADDPDITALREQLLPVFDEYNVDVVMEGHDHYYFRSEPVVENGTVKAEYTTATVNSRGENVSVFTLAENAGSAAGGVFYFMPGASGVKQHSKSFREMPEILTARSELMTNPVFCICDITADHIYFFTYAVDRYRLMSSAVECWGIQK